MTTLSLVLRLNAASCIGFGALFAARPVGVATAIGTVPPQVIFWLGAVLLLNGAHLVLASMRAEPCRIEVLWFSLGDFAWWLATMVLLGADLWITTGTGKLSASLVASLVAGIGATQLFLVGLGRSGLTASQHWSRIGQSWLALPLWVKIWLFGLNAAFLAAPAIVPWETARVILIGYVASGPLLLGFAAYEGGLTRHMGIAHLLTFTPMLAWLVVNPAWIDLSAAALAFWGLFAAMVVVCLVFDLYDLIRWGRGERDIMGAPALMAQ